MLYQLICRGKTTGLSSDPARWSCDNCQPISDFDSYQSSHTHTGGLHNWQGSVKLCKIYCDIWHRLTWSVCMNGRAYAMLLSMVLRCARFARARTSLINHISMLMQTPSLRTSVYQNLTIWYPFASAGPILMYSCKNSFWPPRFNNNFS